MPAIASTFPRHPVGPALSRTVEPMRRRSRWLLTVERYWQADFVTTARGGVVDRLRQFPAIALRELEGFRIAPPRPEGLDAMDATS